MREKNYLKKTVHLLILSVWIGLSLSLSGCKTTSKTIKPAEVQWGKSGEEPTEVWNNYDWVIVSQERYIQ